MTENTMQDTSSFDENKEIKLDYSIESPEERNELVKKIVETIDQKKLTNKYLEILADYLIFAMDKEEKKDKKILTENRLVTVNKRETSYEGILLKFENSEDGIYNLITNDKNIIFSPKFSITQQDIEEIPGLKELREGIEIIEAQEKKAKGKKKFLLKQQIIEMRKDQYILKNAYKKPLYCTNLIKSFTKIDFKEDIKIEYEKEKYRNQKIAKIVDKSTISFFNPEHISILLSNYSKLKEAAWGNFKEDAYYLMEDLDDLVERTLKLNYPYYYDLLIYKIDGKKNAEIQILLEEKHNIYHTPEYISSLWKKKIPKLLAEQAEKDYLIWYFTEKECGKWKRCSKCKEIKLAHPYFFSKNNTAKDGWYSQCKSCRNKKK